MAISDKKFNNSSTRYELEVEEALSERENKGMQLGIFSKLMIMMMITSNLTIFNGKFEIITGFGALCLL